MQAPIEARRPRRTFSALAAALRRALLIGAAFLVAPAFAAPAAPEADQAEVVKVAAAKKKPVKAPKADAAAPKKGKSAAGKAAASKGGKDAGKKSAKNTAKNSAKKSAKKAEEQKPGPLADFGKEAAPDDVVHVANWVSYTRNNKKKAFVVIDKKQAQLYVFDSRGKLKSKTPILLGKAVGDHTVPGIGNKPMSQIKEDEKTTPAGRFLALPGRNTKGEDIIWIDYNAAVSMHRQRMVTKEERRAERMATPDPSDNRISYGCVNVPPKFYNSVLKPTVLKQGAFVYVLPETKSPQQLFGSFDVAGKVQVAGAPAAAGSKAGM